MKKTEKRCTVWLRFLRILTLAVGAVTLCTVLGSCAGKPKAVEMVFYFDSPCASCDEEKKFREVLQAETEDLQMLMPYTLQCVNTFKEGSEEKRQRAEERGVENPAQYSTMLFIGDSVLLGEEIVPNLRQFYWQKAGLGSSESVIEYYYRDDCPDCQQIQTEIDAYLRTKQDKSVVRISTQNMQTKADFKALIEKNKVPKERYQIPYLIENGVHYSGTEEILKHIA